MNRICKVFISMDKFFICSVLNIDAYRVWLGCLQQFNVYTLAWSKKKIVTLSFGFARHLKCSSNLKVKSNRDCIIKNNSHQVKVGVDSSFQEVRSRFIYFLFFLNKVEAIVILFYQKYKQILIYQQ